MQQKVIYLIHLFIISNVYPKNKITVFKDEVFVNALNFNFQGNEIPNQLAVTKEHLLKDHNLVELATVLGVSIITLLTLFVFSLYKNNRLRDKANKLLLQKNSELLQAKEKAEIANNVKTQFLTTITHELRTPLYAITGLTNLLRQDNPSPLQRTRLNSLRYSGEYLLSLINNILDLNKLEVNKLEVEIAVFNLKKRLEDVLIALDKQAIETNNTLQLNFDTSIPQKIKADAFKISQIIINLISNSIKLIKNREINIYVAQVKEYVSETKIKLYFEIEESRIKDKELNINYSENQYDITKCLDLSVEVSIAKKLLNLLGSELKVKNDLEKGSKFFFEIEVEKDEGFSKSKILLDKINFEVMKGKKVLIVEDNKINQLITRKTLEKQLMVCEVVGNGELAIKKVRENTYDLVLMDIHMPGISGLEATRSIREFNQFIPVVALTAVTLNDSIDEFLANGITDVIPKPYKTELFFSTLEKVLTVS